MERISGHWPNMGMFAAGMWADGATRLSGSRTCTVVPMPGALSIIVPGIAAGT